MSVPHKSLVISDMIANAISEVDTLKLDIIDVIPLDETDIAFVTRKLDDIQEVLVSSWEMLPCNVHSQYKNVDIDRAIDTGNWMGFKC